MSLVDKNYCMSSYLTFRNIHDDRINFFEGLRHEKVKPKAKHELIRCQSHIDIDVALKMTMAKCAGARMGILLSGGIDSAILASYMPAGSKAYTLKCVTDAAIDETHRAKYYSEKYHLEHVLIDIHWDDYLKLTPELMKNAAAPVHSIEPQLFKLAMQAKKDGIQVLVTGESADLNFGGMHLLLAKDWGFNEFMARYTFVEPAIALHNPVSMQPVYEKYRLPGDKIDFLRFMDDIFCIESGSSYKNAFNLAQIEYIDPFSEVIPDAPLDLERIRNGEPKYMVRELFSLKYPELPVPDKIPLARSVNEWLYDWQGPLRPEFLENCVKGLNGDQKWLLFCLEWFLNLYEEGRI